MTFAPVTGRARVDNRVVAYAADGLRILERHECLRLLGGVALGRLGLTNGALPVVLPVNFLLDGDRILIRTGRGTKLDAAVAGNVVAFEVDDFDPFSHTGWSVMVTGVARRLVDPDDLHRARRLPLPHWSPGQAEHIVAVPTERISGRRLECRGGLVAAEG